jgi:hypothetical protein
MSADVWFKRDIANALLATYQAARETSYAIGNNDTVRTASFHAGYRSAISTMALFFGISPALVLPEENMTMRAIMERMEGG